MKTNKLYMAVTPDKYELPLIVCDTVSELAKTLKVSANTVHSSISKGNPGTTAGMKFVRVEIDKEDK